MNADKAARQRFTVIVGEGLVRAVGEVTGVAVRGGRLALDGQVLAEGHPVRDAWINQPDPVDNGSQNPVGCYQLPEEKPFVYQPCACGCGEQTDRGLPARPRRARHPGPRPGALRRLPAEVHPVGRHHPGQHHHHLAADQVGVLACSSQIFWGGRIEPTMRKHG